MCATVCELTLQFAFMFDTHRFWQLHLSTAILVMFVAGGFTWLLLPDWRTVFESDSAPLEQFANPTKEPNPHGSGRAAPWDLGNPQFSPTLKELWELFKAKHFWLVFVAENLGALLLLVGIAVLIENVMRGRERRATASTPDP